MDTENKQLMIEAKEALSGKWVLAIGTILIYSLILGGVGIVLPIAGSIAALIIAGPMVLGLSIFLLAIARKEEARLEQIFKGFENFGNSLAAYLLMVVFVFLWTLLLVVPGIIMAIAYSQTFFIMADDKNIGPMDALRKSKKMMDGYKWKYVCLFFRFFGWILLCMLTFGLGFIILAPYMYVAYANFYNDIKDRELPE